MANGMESAVEGSEVLVVGGGIAGCSAAYFLAKFGIRVTLLERGEVAGEASGLNAGSMGGLGWGNTPGLQEHLTMGSLEIFRQLELDMGYDIEFRRSGSMTAIHNETQYKYASERLVALRSGGFSGELMTSREARSIEPGLNPDLPGYFYSPLRGQADPVKTTRALADAAVACGAVIITRAEVKQVTYAGNSWLVETQERSYKSEALVIATGAWTASLGEMLGLGIPVIPVRGQMWATESMPPRIFHTISSMESSHFWSCNPVVDDNSPPELTHDGSERVTRHLYGRQRGNGEIVFGGDREVLGFDRGTDFSGIETNKGHATEVLPALSNLSVNRTWSGLMPFSQDGKPIIGRVPGRDKLFIVTGLCSSGFGRGPSAGQLVADLISRDEAHPSLLESDPARCITEL